MLRKVAKVEHRRVGAVGHFWLDGAMARRTFSNIKNKKGEE